MDTTTRTTAWETTAGAAPPILAAPAIRPFRCALHRRFASALMPRERALRDRRPVPLQSTSSSGPTTSAPTRNGRSASRSEEHTSELQSHSDLVCRLLLEKKKKHHKGLSTVR